MSGERAPENDNPLRDIAVLLGSGLLVITLTRAMMPIWVEGAPKTAAYREASQWGLLVPLVLLVVGCPALWISVGGLRTRLGFAR